MAATAVVDVEAVASRTLILSNCYPIVISSSAYCYNLNFLLLFRRLLRFPLLLLMIRRQQFVWIIYWSLSPSTSFSSPSSSKQRKLNSFIIWFGFETRIQIKDEKKKVFLKSFSFGWFFVLYLLLFLCWSYLSRYELVTICNNVSNSNCWSRLYFFVADLKESMKKQMRRRLMNSSSNFKLYSIRSVMTWFDLTWVKLSWVPLSWRGSLSWWN